MPLHGLKADLELLILIISGITLSYFLTGNTVSNILFTVLLAGLFFLEGLHLESFNPRKKETLIGVIAVYGIGALVGSFFYFLGFGPVFLALGVSAAALGSPSIWSNLTNSDGALANDISNASLIASIVLIPAILALVPYSITLPLENLSLAFVPFLTGFLVKKSSFTYIEEARIHFSKLSFLLIVLITSLQLQILFETAAILSIISVFSAVLVFAAFTVVSLCLCYVFGKFFGLNPKKLRAIAFTGSSKNIAVAFLLAAGISGRAIALVGIYYFVRQFVGMDFVEFFNHRHLDFRQKLGF